MKQTTVLVAALCALFIMQSCQCDEELASVNSKMFVTCEGKDCDGYDFGEVPTGVERTAKFVVENRGDHDLEITAMALAKGLTVYTVDAMDAMAGFAGGKVVVTPAKKTEFSVRYKPETPAPPKDEDQIVFTTNDPSKSSYPFSLSGTGIKASISAEPVAIDFGKIDVKTRVDVAVKVSNTGSDALTISSVEYVDAAGATDIFIDGTVTTPADLAPGDFIEFTLSYLPTAIGKDNGEVRVGNNSKDLPKLAIPVIGEGVAPLMVINPITLDFGSIAKGTNKQLSTNLSNAGNKDLVIQVIETRPGTSKYYTLVGLPSFPYTITPNQNIDVTVQYAPTDRSDDTLNNAAMIRCNDPALTEVDLQGNYVGYVELKGRTHAPSMDATGGTAFQIGCGQPFDPNNTSCTAACIADCCCMEGTIDIENVGDEDLIISSITMTKNESNAFTLLWTKTVPYAIAPGGLEQVGVRFTPLAFGSFNGELTIESNDPLKPTQVVGIAGSATKRN